MVKEFKHKEILHEELKYERISEMTKELYANVKGNVHLWIGRRLSEKG